MGSTHDSRIAHWDHERESRKPCEINGATLRFMGSPALTGLKEKAQGATLGRRFP
jgi:hypothetical protein